MAGVPLQERRERMWNLGPDHERRLAELLDGLRNDPNFTESEIREIETAIRDALDVGAADGDGESDDHPQGLPPMR